MPLTGAPCPQTNDTRAPLLKVLLLRRLTKKLIQKNWRREQLLQVIHSDEGELSAMRTTHAIKIEGTSPGSFKFGGFTRCRSAEDEPSQYYRGGESKSFVNEAVWGARSPSVFLVTRTRYLDASRRLRTTSSQSLSYRGRSRKHRPMSSTRIGSSMRRLAPLILAAWCHREGWSEEYPVRWLVSSVRDLMRVGRC